MSWCHTVQKVEGVWFSFLPKKIFSTSLNGCEIRLRVSVRGSKSRHGRLLEDFSIRRVFKFVIVGQMSLRASTGRRGENIILSTYFHPLKKRIPWKIKRKKKKEKKNCSQTHHPWIHISNYRLVIYVLQLGRILPLRCYFQLTVARPWAVSRLGYNYLGRLRTKLRV